MPVTKSLWGLSLGGEEWSDQLADILTQMIFKYKLFLTYQAKADNSQQIPTQALKRCTVKVVLSTLPLKIPAQWSPLSKTLFQSLSAQNCQKLLYIILDYQLRIQSQSKQIVKMRKQYDFNQWNQTLKTTNQQTPRTKNKPNIPVDHSRKSMSRVKQRMSASPLKVPLQKAINKAVRATGRDNSIDKSNQSRYLGRSSSRREDNSIHSLSRKIYYDQDTQTQQNRAHPETSSFMKKYFDSPYQQVSSQKFISAIMQEYEQLWGTQNAATILEDFIYKISDIFGGQDKIDLRELVWITREDGMIGLILKIFRDIRNEQNIRNSNYASFSQSPQVVSLQRSFEDRINENQSITEIKNVIQEFMESMYQAMQSQIYAKFNVEMRRMVVKYRQAQKIIKKVNEKIISYADIFDAEAKMRQKGRNYESRIQELKNEKDKLAGQLNKERNSVWAERKEKDRLFQENAKLKQNLEKYQNVFLTKAMENSFIEPSLTRNFSNQSRMTERTPDNMQTSQFPQQPFKITIDTHVVHKQNKAPQTKTVTTLHNPPHMNSTNLPSHSPSKRDSFQNSRYLPNYSNVSPSHFTLSRVSTIKPVAPLSPYQNHGSRVGN